MFESDFADSRVSLILAILLIKKSLKELASLVLHELSGSIFFVFFMQNVFHFVPLFSRVCDVLCNQKCIIVFFAFDISLLHR